MNINIPGCMSLAVHDRRWFVLRVHAGSEDDVFLKLLDKGYEAYLPRSRTDRFNRRVRVFKERTNPLMPGYLFVVHPRPGRPADDWREIVPYRGEGGIKGVVGTLKGEHGPLLIPCPVIEMLMSMEFDSAYDDTRAAKALRGETRHSELARQFRPGSLFKVVEGPFSSFMAKVDRLTDQDRVVGLVEIFGRSVPVEFDPDELENEKPRKDRPEAA